MPVFFSLVSTPYSAFNIIHDFVHILKNNILLLSYKQKKTAKLQTKTICINHLRKTPVMGPAIHKIRGYFRYKQIPSHKVNEVCCLLRGIYVPIKLYFHLFRLKLKKKKKDIRGLRCFSTALS